MAAKEALRNNPGSAEDVIHGVFIIYLLIKTLFTVGT